jgi:hypothetical protein
MLCSTWAGCANRNFSPGTTKGVIVVDSPEVFTRERIVNDRRLQEAWLKKQLELCDYVDGFQGLIDLPPIPWTPG